MSKTMMSRSSEVVAAEENRATWVLGVVGSPRLGGNTETLVDEVLRGAGSGGAQVEKVILSELSIGPCRACNSCVRTGVCVQQDDMPALLKKMQRSSVWVLGTPVYWWGPSAQFKAFLDRWYGAERVVTFRGKQAVVVIALGDTSSEIARFTEGMISSSLAWKGTALLATVLAPGVSGRSDVKKRPDLLAAAYRAGRKAVEEDGSK